MWRPRPQTVIFQNQLLFVQKVSIGGRHKRTHTEVQGASWFQFSCHPPLLLFHPRNPPFGLFWLLLLQMNILVRTLMDGPTSSLLFFASSQGCRNSHFKAYTMHNAPVKFRLFRNAGSSSLMRPGCQSIGTIPEALAMPLALHESRENICRSSRCATGTHAWDSYTFY